MSTIQHDIPQGFAPIEANVADTPNLDIIDVGDLRGGEVLIYRGVEKWTSARGDHHLAHLVQREGDPNGKMRGVWQWCLPAEGCGLPLRLGRLRFRGVRFVRP